MAGWRGIALVAVDTDTAVALCFGVRYSRRPGFGQVFRVRRVNGRPVGTERHRFGRHERRVRDGERADWVRPSQLETPKLLYHTFGLLSLSLK